jgi:hypothetical protein
MYDPKADRFNPNAVADAQARHMARMKLRALDESADEEQAKSILDAFNGPGGWLRMQTWRRNLPGVQRPGPRQRPI